MDAKSERDRTDLISLKKEAQTLTGNFSDGTSIYLQIAEMLENGTYYSREEQGRWICTNCGYIHDGKQAPSVCPVCRHEKGYFLPYEYAPYKGAGK